MNGFKHSVETVCGQPGALSESMVTTFLATHEASVIIKGPIKSGVGQQYEVVYGEVAYTSFSIKICFAD
uniref:Uncharacterized protein n=1 Tax=Romanomermis culicivorax TaxID=13658 RepID=A0A915IS48_ROMCU